MCLKKSFIWKSEGPGWVRLPVPCKRCWQCRASRVNDYVGRSLSEASQSDRVCAITLTYRPRDTANDDLADKILTPEHFQKAIRSLRKRGHKVRYLVAGEYGGRKGRAHFHALLFFKGKPPEIAHKKRDWPDWWPHGHVWCDWSADERAVRYVCKYMLKDQEQNWLSMSKKPALGAEWFAKKAAQHVEKGVVPRGFDYMPPGGNKARPYVMTGATRRDFIRAIRDGLEARGTFDREAFSDWMTLALEKVERQEAIDKGHEFMASLTEEQWREINFAYHRPAPPTSAELLKQVWMVLGQERVGWLDVRQGLIVGIDGKPVPWPEGLRSQLLSTHVKVCGMRLVPSQT